MKLVGKLLDYIHDGFDKEPDAITAMRLRHVSDTFSWRVSERILTLFNGATVLSSIDLSAYTMRTLVEYLATLPGVSVVYVDVDLAPISACALIDGSGRQDQSNGDIITAYQSTLWTYLDALTTELVKAKASIINMLYQMTIPNAEQDWLDEWGGYFGVLRLNGETDQAYSNRIIAEVIRPRGNNKAIEAALLQQYGQTSTVTDIIKYGGPEPAYNAYHLNDGAILHNSSASLRYGLFNIVIGYDLLSSSTPLDFVASVRAFVEKLRCSGTFLDTVQLSTSALTDSFTPPTDGGMSMTLTAYTRYDGSVTYGSGLPYGAHVTGESL